MPSSLVDRLGGPSSPVLKRPGQVELDNATPARTRLPTSDGTASPRLWRGTRRPRSVAGGGLVMSGEGGHGADPMKRVTFYGHGA